MALYLCKNVQRFVHSKQTISEYSKPGVNLVSPRCLVWYQSSHTTHWIISSSMSSSSSGYGRLQVQYKPLKFWP
uniref:Uncharacterized protein n=1 Tax=Ciona intestinalis TaxID=7719 RepID=H2XWK4_CIOIN